MSSNIELLKIAYWITVVSFCIISLFSCHVYAQQTGSSVNAAILTLIYGQHFDYSSPAYQARNPLIYFSNNNGETIHKTADNATLGNLFDSLNMGLNDKCFIFPDKRAFCTNGLYSLKFFINHQKVDSIRDYVIKENDRILISYGNENSTQIQQQIDKLDNIEISNISQLPTPITVPALLPEENIILASENNSTALVLEGKLFLNTIGSPLPAYYYCDKASKLDLSNTQARQCKDQALNTITNPVNQISAADKILSQNPNDQQAMITKAQTLIILGQYGQTSPNERTAILNSLTDHSTSNFNLLEEQYRTLDLMGKYEETLPVIDKLIGEFSGHSEEWMYLQWKAVTLYKLGKYDEASSVLDQSNKAAQVQLNGNSDIIYDVEKAIIYDKMGKPDLANTYTDFITANVPEAATNGQLDYVKGSFAMNPIAMEDYATALEYFERVSPNSPVYDMASIMKVVAKDRIAVASNISSTNSTSLTQMYALTGTSKIPKWVKNIFMWYGQGKISEDELLSALQFLIQQNIIKIR